MIDNAADRKELSEAVCRLVDRFAKKHPNMSVPDVAASLGVVAGTVAGVNIPPGNPEVDLLTANMVGLAFGEAMKASRALRAS